MNWRLTELLSTVRKSPVKLEPIDDWKKAICIKGFQHEGKYYRPWSKEAPDELSFKAADAKSLVQQGLIEIIRGGYCDTKAVAIDSANSLFAFVPWSLDSASNVNEETAYDHCLLRVRLRKRVQVIAALKLEPNDEFFVPWSLIRLLGFTLEDELEQGAQGALILFTDQTPYVDATTEAKS